MNIQPHGEQLRKAVRWISEERINCGIKPVPIHQIVDKAGLKFILTPHEADFLIRKFVEQGDG